MTTTEPRGRRPRRLTAGRIGVYEAVRIDDRLRRLIGENASEDALAAAAFEAGGRLSETARRYVAEGVTTVEEAIRVTRQETSEHVGV